jgi:uncharacterized protein
MPSFLPFFQAARTLHTRVPAGLRRVLLVSSLVCCVALIAPLRSQVDWLEMRWSDLMPKSWDGQAFFNSLNVANLQDGDPAAAAALRELRQVWDNAPVQESMNGKRVKIRGYVLPLDKQDNGVKEYLIVPYFGACIHTPPPPANQVIHAISKNALKDVVSMRPLITYGTLTVNRSQTQWGVASYQLNVQSISTN